MVFYFGKKELRILLEKSLSRRELEAIGRLNEIGGLTFSAAVRALCGSRHRFATPPTNEGKNIPESTAKAVLRGLSEKGLIEKVNGHPISVTEFGRKIFEVMKNGV